MLIYDGDHLLSTREIEYVTGAIDRGYPFAVEMSVYPDHKWIEGNLKERSYQVEVDGWSAHREYATRTGPLYSLIQRGEDRKGGFLMLKDKEDHDAVVKGLPDLVISAKPFRSAISQG